MFRWRPLPGGIRAEPSRSRLSTGIWRGSLAVAGWPLSQVTSAGGEDAERFVGGVSMMGSDATRSDVGVGRWAGSGAASANGSSARSTSSGLSLILDDSWSARARVWAARSPSPSSAGGADSSGVVARDGAAVGPDGLSQPTSISVATSPRASINVQLTTHDHASVCIQTASCLVDPRPLRAAGRRYRNCRLRLDIGHLHTQTFKIPPRRAKTRLAPGVCGPTPCPASPPRRRARPPAARP